MTNLAQEVKKIDTGTVQLEQIRQFYYSLHNHQEAKKIDTGTVQLEQIRQFYYSLHNHQEAIQKNKLKELRKYIVKLTGIEKFLIDYKKNELTAVLVLTQTYSVRVNTYAIEGLYWPEELIKRKVLLRPDGSSARFLMTCEEFNALADEEAQQLLTKDSKND